MSLACSGRRLVGAVENDVQVQGRAVAGGAGQWQVEETEFIREGKVLGQQAHAGMHAVFVRQQDLVTGEADDLWQACQ